MKVYKIGCGLCHFNFITKNLILPREAGSSMGQACPALRESEFSGSALEFCA